MKIKPLSLRLMGKGGKFTKREENVSFLKFEAHLKLDENGNRYDYSDFFKRFLYADPSKMNYDISEIVYGSSYFGTPSDTGESIVFEESFHNVLDANVLELDGIKRLLKTFEVFSEGELESEFSDAKSPKDVPNWYRFNHAARLMIVSADFVKDLDYGNLLLMGEEIEIDVMFNFFSLFHNVVNLETLDHSNLDSLWLQFTSPNTQEVFEAEIDMTTGSKKVLMRMKYYINAEFEYDIANESYMAVIGKEPSMRYDFSMRFDDLREALEDY